MACTLAVKSATVNPSGPTANAETVARAFAGSFETGDDGGAPTQQPSELLLGLRPRIPDVTQGLGVTHLGLARALTEAGSLASHSCPFVQRLTSAHAKTLNPQGLEPSP